MTPKLRFKGFTDDWEQRKLGDMCEIVGGGTPSTGISEYWDGDIDWYAPAEISDQIYLASSQRKITQDGFNNSSAKMLPVGTILFTSRAGIGKTAILQKEGCTNQGFQSIVPKEAQLDSYFIFSRTEELKRYAETVGAGSTFVEVSGKQMANMELMMPKALEEQQVIGEQFKRMDNLITLHQRKYEQLIKIKKGLCQKLFNQEIRFKLISKLDYPDWENKLLKDILNEYSEINSDSLYEAVSIGSKGIRKRCNIYSKPLSNDISRNKVIYKSTMIIGMGSKQIDFGFIYEDKENIFSVSPAYTTYQVKDCLCKYLEELLTLKNKELSSKCLIVGARQGKSVDKNAFLNSEFRFPCIEEQKQIVDFLLQFDKQINIINDEITVLKKIKKGFLQQMFI